MRNLATLRNDGTQIAASAASKIRSDSAPVRQREIGWPDSRHMISGTVPPITAPHATTRGNKSADGGVVGFIGSRAIPPVLLQAGPCPAPLFPFREFGNKAPPRFQPPPGVKRKRQV